MEPITAGLIGAGLGSLFGSKDKKVKWSEPAESSNARKKLLARGQDSVAFPTRKIADLSEMELGVEQRVQGILDRGPSAERQTALDAALKQATTPVDVANMPELQAIFKQIQEQGELESNRLGRSLQLRGTIGSTGGRDILGRNLMDVQERLVGAASPYLMQARDLQSQAVRDVGTLVGQKQTDEISRLGLGSAVGSLRRNITQAMSDADYQKILNDLKFRYETQPNILSMATTTPQPVISGGGPSVLQQISGVASLMAPFVSGGTSLPGNQAAISAAGGLGSVANSSSGWLSSSMLLP